MATWTHIVTLDMQALPMKNLPQGAIWEPVERLWYFAQAKTLPRTDAERLHIHRYTAAGKYLDTMTLEHAHGQCFAVRRVGQVTEIWFGQDWWEGGKRTRIRPVRLPYVAGRIERAASPAYSALPITKFVGNWARPFMCGRRCHVITRHISRDNVETYQRRLTKDVLAGREGQMRELVMPQGGEPFQGAAAGGGFLYRLYGAGTPYKGPSVPVILTKHRWSDGKLIERAVFKSRFGLLPGERKGYEPEGLCWKGDDLIAGVRVGGRAVNREFRLGRIDF